MGYTVQELLDLAEAEALIAQAEADPAPVRRTGAERLAWGNKILANSLQYSEGVLELALRSIYDNDADNAAYHAKKLVHEARFREWVQAKLDGRPIHPDSSTARTGGAGYLPERPQIIRG